MLDLITYNLVSAGTASSILKTLNEANVTVRPHIHKFLSEGSVTLKKKIKFEKHLTEAMNHRLTHGFVIRYTFRAESGELYEESITGRDPSLYSSARKESVQNNAMRDAFENLFQKR